MKKFIYPAVFYFDKNTKTYCAAIKDLALFVDGETIEEAHKNASDVLESFVSMVLKFGDEMPTPSVFDEFIVQFPKNLVMLVECYI